MKSADYNNQMFKQVQDLIKRCDSLSQEIKDIKRQHKQEIYELNQKHEKEVKKLNEKINSLEKENAELKEKVDILEGKSNKKIVQIQVHHLLKRNIKYKIIEKEVIENKEVKKEEKEKH